MRLRVAIGMLLAVLLLFAAAAPTIYLQLRSTLLSQVDRALVDDAARMDDPPAEARDAAGPGDLEMGTPTPDAVDGTPDVAHAGFQHCGSAGDLPV